MNNSTQTAALKPFFRLSDILVMALITVGYLLLSALLVGFKPEQVFLAVLTNALYFASKPTRKFILGFSVFIVYWVIFDYMKALPNYAVSPVHIESIYNAEKSVFGIHSAGKILTPNEWLLAKSNSFLDVMSGVFYLTWVPVPLMFAAFLFYKNKRQFLYFSFTFLVVNLVGFVIYYSFPAAPPWYVQAHGFVFNPHTPGNTAGLARFDAYFNVTVFKSIYEKSSNVFAAMPSLHSAYPAIVFYYAMKNKLGLANILFGTIMVGVWFAAVYTSHHYVLDVLAGILCAIVGINLFNALLKTKSIGGFIDRLYGKIV
ncbi:phosphatase PAP2 family protein [Taibaiella soli]|uniref:Inositol phosphorylceramide synthase n=1 Tax=Taibaiella soli TaxID=1649169 RepID=A0A2W2BCG6_9BACT|nr:phosphatase PAP2 family protein [Taibaiella soli]PZF73919.1 inositol phosphorylceramide synthase [Taibaiella soli]